MIDPLTLIDACEQCYRSPLFTAGPDGRDAAIVSKINGQTVLAFRGTLTQFHGTAIERAASWLDWVNDLRAELSYRHGYPGLIHAGFADSLDALLLVLPRFDRSPPPIIVGHSKGGSLALLMGMYLLGRYGVRAKIATFAAPRAGNADFAHAASSALDIDRYENPYDIVPKLPPVDYASAGYLITPSAKWTPPRGLHENHSLETGYKPWVEMNQPSSPSSPAAQQETPHA